MGTDLAYVSLADMKYLLAGLYLNVSRCADVLDHALVAFNKETGIPDEIVEWNMKGGNRNGPLSFPGRGRFIVSINQMRSPSRGMFWTSTLLEKKDESQHSPVAFINMRSPSLDLPMRLEIPLRALMKGGQPLAGKYTVYLHVLLTEKAGEFLYYGITKRNWNVRFTEHTRSALKPAPRRRFARRMNELISARVSERFGQPQESQKLRGIITTLCAVGFSESEAMDAEEYLVEKYSLSSKHDHGLNMIPGGRAGVSALQKIIGKKIKIKAETLEKERILDKQIEE